MKKITKRKSLEIINDKLWKLIIHKRDGVCQRCGDDYILSAHHIYYKSQSSYLRCSPINGVLLCRACHCWIHSKGVNSIDVVDFLFTLGEERITELKRLKDEHRINKWVMGDIESTNRVLKDLWESMQ